MKLHLENQVKKFMKNCSFLLAIVIGGGGGGEGGSQKFETQFFGQIRDNSGLALVIGKMTEKAWLTRLIEMQSSYFNHLRLILRKCGIV